MPETKLRLTGTSVYCAEKCFNICDHKARDYTDDTERFLKDLEDGKEISVLAAPSVRLNFLNDEYKNLFGYLKKKGSKQFTTCLSARISQPGPI